VLASKKEKRGASFLNQRPSSSSQLSLDRLNDDDSRNAGAERIDEVSEPSSPDEELDLTEYAGPSILSSMLRRSPPEGESPSAFPNDSANAGGLRTPRSPSISLNVEPASPISRLGEDTSETTPLLGPKRHRSSSPDDVGDLESQKPPNTWYAHSSLRGKAAHKIRDIAAALNPKTWSKKTIWEKAVVDPMRCLPAVVVGLLLNILDALSYGVYMVIGHLHGPSH